MKTKMNFKTLVLGLLIGTSSFAQEEALPKKNYHRLGLHGGTTTGIGFSYKVSTNDKYQIQLAAIPFASSTSKYVNGGLTFFRKIVNTRVFDILVYIGGNYQFTSSKYSYGEYYYYDYNTSDYVYSSGAVTDKDSQFNASFGLAFEVGPSEIFKFCFQAGYGVYDLADANNWQTLPSAGVGIEFGINQILSKNK